MSNTLYDALIAPHATSEQVFLECDDGTVLSYGGYVRRVAQMAHVLVNAGVAPGDRVFVQAPKVSDTIALYGAAIQAGAVYLPVNTAYTLSELSYFIQDAQPRAIICDPKDEAAMAQICGRQGVTILTLGPDGTGSLATAADAAEDTFKTVARGPDDLAALLYTSGTTGRSKGAMLSHKNLLSNAISLADLWEITDQDRLIHALPIFHTHGLFVALNTCLLVGARVRFMAAFNGDEVLKELPKSTLMMGVPTFYTRLLDDPRLTRDLCAEMRLFVSGSAPLLADTHTEFARRTGHRILERYGMTETNMSTSNPYEGDRVAGTVGYALPGVEVVITDPDTGAPVAAGDIGMIEVRGDNVFQGYWNMPEKTAEELRDTGFFITGDLGVQSDDGRISIVGRQKDLIISGGYNIYPKEIEELINNVDGVLESAVFGVPHPDFGESVLAAVILEQGASVTPDAIAAQVEPLLARFKHPRRYILCDALPRNTMGKVQKNVLRDTYNGSGAAPE
ncbi:malonate--CoA ligase [Oceaniglobus ichthyenteri]|uniref:malonate--CoA ligase n=1 Tax=Oceaniglobus ichthyenteri TaxID=2136177 RepID=UPI000D3D6832|nr:malonyl-CoA synthase [Oceaniglobus ichthyenteri]